MAPPALRVVLSLVANGVLGAVWYHESTLRRPWRQGHGLSLERADQLNSPAALAISVVQGVVQTFVAETVLDAVDGGRSSSPVEQFLTIFSIWLAFTFLAVASHNVFVTGVNRAAVTTAIDGVFHLVQLGLLVLIRNYIVPS